MSKKSGNEIGERMSPLTDEERRLFSEEHVRLTQQRLEKYGNTGSTGVKFCASCGHEWIGWPESTCPRAGRHPAPAERPEMRRCPGCGDRGDIDHIAACCGNVNDRWFRELCMQAYASWHAGKATVMEMLSKQLRRRKGVDVGALRRGAEYASRRHVKIVGGRHA